MRLLGRPAEARQDQQPYSEQDQQPPPEPTPLEAARREYVELGSRVTSIMTAAEEAAETIRAEARAEADRLRAEAEQEGERARLEAARTRQQAEEEARTRLADADQEARSLREQAEADARETENASLRRQDELREETRALEEKRQRALYELRDIVSHLQNVLIEAPAGAKPNGDDLPVTAVVEPEPPAAEPAPERQPQA